MRNFLYLLSIACVLASGVVNLAAVCKHNIDGNHARTLQGKKGKKLMKEKGKVNIPTKAFLEVFRA